jgi:uncharacterized protein (DUF3820 family)
MNGDFVMPWGAYKGKKIKDVPGSYFLHLYTEGKATGLVKKYIDDNLEEIKKCHRGRAKAA